jgi:hypothetical protein
MIDPGVAPGASETPAAHVAPPASTSPAPSVRNLSRGTVLAASLETADGLWGKFMGLMGRPSLDAAAPPCAAREQRDPHVDVHAVSDTVRGLRRPARMLTTGARPVLSHPPAPPRLAPALVPSGPRRPRRGFEAPRGHGIASCGT